VQGTLLCAGSKQLQAGTSRPRKRFGGITSTAKTESYKDQLLESLKDPETAAHYLTACLEDGNPSLSSLGPLLSSLGLRLAVEVK
jgi:DNA-binding phage protein